MPKAKPKFVRLTVSFTYYGVGKTLKDAQQDALNEYHNAGNSEPDKDFEEVKQEHTSIDQTYIDFVMDENYGVINEAKLIKKGGK